MISHLPATNGARHSSAVQPCKGLKKSHANHHETARTIPVDTSALHPHSILQTMASTIVARSHNAGWPNPEHVGAADAVGEAEVETVADVAGIAGLREDRGGEVEWCIGVEDTVRHEEHECQLEEQNAARTGAAAFDEAVGADLVAVRRARTFHEAAAPDDAAPAPCEHEAELQIHFKESRHVSRPRWS
jgi:hypothetical protein